MQSIVGIKLSRAGKIYNFSAPSFEVKVGDKVIAETSNGLALGTVAEAVKQVEESTLDEPLKPVVRIATDRDLARAENLATKARNQIPVIEEKIKNLKLDMNVTSAEYTFDETKITISFTSEGRVDFRELLKVLASTLKCKIELRQIGIRDEVKAVGGLGLCGRECCCTVFLKDSAHVSVKMAKLQNLSLNPTKTGGLCGRMMCCLAYEEPVYKELAKNLPEVGKLIKTPDGEGTVTYNDILGQKVTVKIVQGDGAYKLKEFTLDELSARPAEKKPEPAQKPEIQPEQENPKNQESDNKPKNKKRFHYNNKKGDKK